MCTTIEQYCQVKVAIHIVVFTLYCYDVNCILLSIAVIVIVMMLQYCVVMM